MPRIPLIPAVAAVIGVLLLLLNTVYVVKQTEQVLVLQFGAAVRAINAPNQAKADQGLFYRDGPGLYVKVPFVESIERFDRRNVGLNLQTTTIISADQEQLSVDAYARYRITDPLRFYGALRNKTQAETQLDTVMVSSLRRVLGSVPLDDIISRRRAELMASIRSEMNARARPWGVEIIDVRIRQADLPETVAERVFQRMRTQREQVAA
jgi:membrane protease subunit HflC